jgi:Ca2+-binding EF-hand superfamily protein
MELLWSYCDVFARMDQQCGGAVRRVDFIAAMREKGTDLEFQKVARKLDLAGRFRTNAKDMSLHEFVCLTLPRVPKEELTRAYRWVDLWKARHAIRTCGLGDDINEFRSLFHVLEEDGKGTVSVNDLVRAQIFTHDEVLSAVQPGRGVDEMGFEDFCQTIGPEIHKKYRRGENDGGRSATGSNFSKRDVFQNLLATLASSRPDALDRVCTPPVEDTSRLASLSPLHLPRLPYSHREQSANSQLSAAASGTILRSEETHGFQTLRTRRERAVCGANADDELKRYEFLRNCTPLFLRYLLDELQCEFFKPDDIITKEGEFGDKIYLLRRGAVEILVGSDLRKVANLDEGIVFGEMALLEAPGKRTATVRATELCDCRTLDRRTFLKLLEHFPDDKELFRRVAKQRGAQLKNRRANSEWRKAKEFLSMEANERPIYPDTCMPPLVAAT